MKLSWTEPNFVTPRICASSRTFSCPVVDGKLISPCRTLDIPNIEPSPEAVNISNVASLVDSEGKPHFKFIVEGANLFLTQQARLYLEKRKVVLFKDSSANKGTKSARQCFTVAHRIRI